MFAFRSSRNFGSFVFVYVLDFKFEGKYPTVLYRRFSMLSKTIAEKYSKIVNKFLHELDGSDIFDISFSTGGMCSFHTT